MTLTEKPMAIYYPSATDQRDGSVTPFLQEQLSSSSFDDLSLPSGNMMMYMNTQTLPSNSYMEFMSEHSLSEVGGSRNGLLNIQPSAVVTTVNGDPYVDDSCRKLNVHNQSLSLSLSSDLQSGMAASSHYQYSTTGLDSFSHLPMSAEGTISGSFFQLPSEFSGDYGHIYNSFHMKTVCDSKFLKAAQQLLDEVVSVQDVLKKSETDKTSKAHQSGTDKESADKSCETANLGSSEASSSELSAAARQELQNKKSKLMSMLDEVDRRFSHYYHQMHVMISWFDSIAGQGAAKPYTKLALQTISRHFRCLRDAIVGQIQATRRNLGEHDTSPDLLCGGIPRLRYVDQQIRQVRGFNQLGVSRHSWRTQRGLPESSVTVLRAWLFEHFLHPYPKELEKVMLARQTGLTRGQVANWFINARVRLWKPMVEEMYREEFGESEAIFIDHKPDLDTSLVSSSTGHSADFLQNRSHGDDDLGFGLMKFEGDRRSDTSLDHNHNHNHNHHGHRGLYQSEIITLNKEGDVSSLAQDSQVSLGLGVTRP